MTDAQAVGLLALAAPLAVVILFGMVRGYSVWISVHKPPKRNKDEED